jgi:hypothetical protein
MPNDVSERNGPMHISGSIGVSPGGTTDSALNGLTSQITWANQIRTQINLSFDRLVASVEAGINRYKGLAPEEVTALLAMVEEHRAKVLGVQDAQYFLDNWQDPVDRVQRLIHTDERWKNIVESRAVRNPRPDTLVPLRYMGFDDAAGTRIFKFGRLPATATTVVYTVSASVDLFRKHKISFQDGPAMCSAIVGNGDVESHELTDEDCIAFLSLKASKVDRTTQKRKPAIPPAS